MDAYLSNSQNRANLFDAAPVLVVADTEAAKARARRTVAATRARLADVVDVEGGRDRIDRQIATSALWVELDGEPDPTTESLLERIAEDASGGLYAAVIAAPLTILDRLGAFVIDPSLDVIVDAEEPERAAALAHATSSARRAERLSDVTADKNAARLRQLSDEVSRIASTLARLSAGPAAVAHRPAPAPIQDLPAVPAETVRTVIRARRLRSRYFHEDLFADPAWDMLLDLLQAEIAQLRVPVSSLCIAAAVPATTALRWLKTMVQEGLFRRRADPHAGRRVFVELAPETSMALRRYFAELGGQVAVI
jgi:DNA-binding MarR family transcriptional regulator